MTEIIRYEKFNNLTFDLFDEIDDILKQIDKIEENESDDNEKIVEIHDFFNFEINDLIKELKKYLIN